MLVSIHDLVKRATKAETTLALIESGAAARLERDLTRSLAAWAAHRRKRLQRMREREKAAA